MPSSTLAGLETTFECVRPVHFGHTLGWLQRGPFDPTLRVTPEGVWRASSTPRGPATLRLQAQGKTVKATAWGPGAEHALAQAPVLVGAAVVVCGLFDADAIVGPLKRRFRGLRMGGTGDVADALMGAILEQRVTVVEAHRAYVGIVRAFGEDAPVPLEAPRLRVAPTAERLAELRYFDLHQFGVERQRAATLIRAMQVLGRIPERDLRSPRRLPTVLRPIPGVGPWTIGQVSAQVFGDPDAVVLGDLGLPRLVAWTFAGERWADDERMLELLEPYRGQRGRVIRLILAGGHGPERRTPRLPKHDIREH